MPVRSKNHTGSENLQHIDLGHLPELWPGNVRVCVLALISLGRGPPPVEVLGAAWLGLRHVGKFQQGYLLGCHMARGTLGAQKL